jgi:hypothetical protein
MLPESKIGRRQVIKMILRNNGKEGLLRVLLDCEATIPILNKSWAQRKNIPTIESAEPKIVENFAGKLAPEIGLTYTHPVGLKYQKHCLVDSFEIGLTDSECDAILSFG